MDANSIPIPKGQRDVAKAKQPVHRGGSRYKEKYQALREKFDQVNTEHEDWRRKLDLANARIKKLQAENDLLLDAISITVPATPSLLQLIQPSPTSTTPVPTPPHAQQHQHSTGQAPHHHMNGHHSNGRFREREPERGDLTPHGHEPTTNGHSS